MEANDTFVSLELVCYLKKITHSIISIPDSPTALLMSFRNQVNTKRDLLTEEIIQRFLTISFNTK